VARLEGAGGPEASGLTARLWPLHRSALPPDLPETYGLSMELLERESPLDCETTLTASTGRRPTP
jgi:hypothetical protein